MDDSFSSHQLKTDGCQFPLFRRNRNKFWGRNIPYVKDGLIVKRLNHFETNISETISLELTISNKKWFMMFPYTPLIDSNKLKYFNEVSNTFNKAVNKYDNIEYRWNWQS